MEICGFSLWSFKVKSYGYIISVGVCDIGDLLMIVYTLD